MIVIVIAQVNDRPTLQKISQMLLIPSIFYFFPSHQIAAKLWRVYGEYGLATCLLSLPISNPPYESMTAPVILFQFVRTYQIHLMKKSYVC